IQWVDRIRENSLLVAFRSSVGPTRGPFSNTSASGLVRIDLWDDSAETVFSSRRGPPGPAVDWTDDSRVFTFPVAPPYLVHGGRLWHYGMRPGFYDLATGIHTPVEVPGLSLRDYRNASFSTTEMEEFLLEPDPAGNGVFLLNPNGLFQVEPGDG
ncbi:MAG: hypothetical protein ACLFRP_07245, partial [Puniceicoccaceae bacterium]